MLKPRIRIVLDPANLLEVAGDTERRDVIASAVNLILDPIKCHVAALAMPPFRGVENVSFQLGDNSGLVGVAGLALANY